MLALWMVGQASELQWRGFIDWLVGYKGWDRGTKEKMRFLGWEGGWIAMLLTEFGNTKREHILEKGWF